MEEKLREIHQKFLSGQRKQAIVDIETLINEYPNDDLFYKAHDFRGYYLNYLGQHVEAIESYRKIV